MKIYDCFLFYNEIQLLKFRLEELNDVVDYFVIVEGSKTFVGKPKESYYKLYENEFLKYKDKIYHHIILDMDSNNPWINERNQRNGAFDFLKILNIDDNDLIIFSDCDEVPDSDTISEIRKANWLDKIYAFNQDFYYYNLNTKLKQKWDRAKIAPYHIIYNMMTTGKVGSMDEIRCNPTEYFDKGGWHFSYFGDINMISNKLSNFSHQEYNNEKINSFEHIKSSVEKKLNIFDGLELLNVEIEHNPYLPKNYKMLL
jgi:beta-1,4-mannosyl-glycoprotein beta-1,4-N-acetylglucosaminyltransferase